MKKQIAEWKLQLAWFVAGIFATGALWYFISVKSAKMALASAIAAALFCVLAVLLHRIRDKIAEEAAAEEAKAKRMHEPLVLKVGEERITFDELHRSADYDVVKVNTEEHMIGVMSEHTWLRYRYPDAEMEMQSLSSLDRLKQDEIDAPEATKIHFDVMDICFPDGRKKKVYFDISAFYGGMAHAKLDPASRIAKKLNELYA